MDALYQSRIDGFQALRMAGHVACQETEELAEHRVVFLHGPGSRQNDLATGAKSTHDFGPHAEPGAVVFAEASASAREDEGCALGFVYDRSRNASDLVILVAARPEAAPLARIALPQRVPHGFHGSWVRAHELE